MLNSVKIVFNQCNSLLLTSKEISIDLLKSEDIVIDQEYSEKTGFSVGSTVIRQERLYFGDGTPNVTQLFISLTNTVKRPLILVPPSHAVAGYQPGRGKNDSEYAGPYLSGLD